MTGHFTHQGHLGYPESAHIDHMSTNASNRLRSESGSSESSRGSGSTSSGNTRRRSHRPRGCRGGSNRRRNNNGDAKNKASRNRPSQGDFHSKTPIRTNKYSYANQFHSQQQPEAYHSYMLSMRDPIPAELPHGYVQGLSGECNINYLGFNCNGDRGYMDVAPRNFPALQSSFSESSNEVVYENEGCQILPPMPPNAFQEPRPIPWGPNPYALNQSISATGAFFPSNISYGIDDNIIPRANAEPFHSTLLKATSSSSHSVGVLQPLCQIRGESLQNIDLREVSMSTRKDLGFVSDGKSIDPNQDDKNYHAKRLEKQRQNVEGGSLFVTSPRSFLMGLKKETFEDTPQTTVGPIMASF